MGIGAAVKGAEKGSQRRSVITNGAPPAGNSAIVPMDPNLYYKYCPILIEHLPTETVNLLISRSSDLNPRNLIPALMRYQRAHEAETKAQPEVPNSANQPEKVNEAIRYLEYVVLNCTLRRYLHVFSPSFFSSKNIQPFFSCKQGPRHSQLPPFFIRFPKR